MASTTTRTSASWSAYVVVTWRAPVRSDTGQWMRRSRSPVRNGPDVGELGAAADPRAPVLPDEPHRVGEARPAR